MTRTALAISALAAALALSSTGPVLAAEDEKCYGVAKAGANDCETATNSCAGTSVEDAQGDAWIYVPAGLCEKLAGGSLDPKA